MCPQRQRTHPTVLRSFVATGPWPVSVVAVGSNAAFRFLTGPLRRNLDHIGDIQIQTELDQASCVIPGSYAVVHNALVKLQSGEEKHFVIAGTPNAHLLEKLTVSMKGAGMDSRKRLPLRCGQLRASGNISAAQASSQTQAHPTMKTYPCLAATTDPSTLTCGDRPLPSATSVPTDD